MSKRAVRRNKPNFAARRRATRAALSTLPEEARRKLQSLDPSLFTPGQTAPGIFTKPISVAMIVKNCAASLKNCLQSLKDKFLQPCDEIVVLDTGSTDDTPAVARALGARVLDGTTLRKNMAGKVAEWLPEWQEHYGKEKQFDQGCIMDFAGARQVVTDAAKNDYIFWIDSDDVFDEEQAGSLRLICEEHLGKDVDAVFLNYFYAFDKDDGRCTTILKRERIVDRRLYEWKGKCHETLIPRPGAVLRGAGWFENYRGGIIHAAGRRDHTLSDIRNYCIIRDEIETDLAYGRQPDVRSVFYLGNACRGLKRHAEALQMYTKTYNLSGSRDDRYSAAYYIAITYLAPEIQRPAEALDWAYTCLRLKPEDPRSHFMLARCYHILGRHQDSLMFFESGKKLPEPTATLHSYDPEHIHTLPYYMAISVGKELKDEALVTAAGEHLARHRGDHPEVREVLEDAKNWLAGRTLVKAVQTMTINSRPKDPNEQIENARKLINLLPEVPKELEEMGVGRKEPPDDRLVSAAYTNEGGEQVVERKQATLDDDLTIWCAQTLEAWGPRTDSIGGSEKAVIQMAPRLQKNGWRVTVYCNCPLDQRGLDAASGVIWRHWSELDTQRERGTVIFWRSVKALTVPWPIQRRIFWGHDVQRPDQWTDVEIAAADEVWLLSDYHATTLGPVLPKLKDKLWITRNGIDTALFEKYDGQAKRPNAVVYCSSPDRGILTAIDAFQKAFKDDKTATLDICYGFNRNYRDIAAKQEYGNIPDLRRDMNYLEYMKLVLGRIDQDPRITYHGRVSWERVAELLSRAGVWLYPTRFPEISCMSAMEAQAAGCRIVATDYAALAETILWSSSDVHLCHPDAAEIELAAAARPAEDPGLRAWARHKYSYDLLAKEWTARLRRSA